MKLPSRPSAIALCGLLALAGCSSQDQDQGANPGPAASAQADAAARKLDTYRQLLRIHNDEMAVTMGHDILDHYPGSAAAKEVEQTLPEIEKRWKENSEKNRLATLWLYQVSPMEGGTQSTATIYASQPAANDRVRLVLRRHTAWGQNAFLFGSGHGFVCRGNCTIPATFDGKPHGIKAFAPSTGEPALMIRDDSDFIARLQKAKKITMDVTLVDGEKKETLVYEVGGFDPAKWQALPKKK
ncbi:MAG: hypothetical protein HOQ10_14205 [Frateuria sp.]|uniref:hypothetical protein n=1 Tax=Frateuria sp. TaxID=2211372 RepID=UPI00181D7DB9|nr:hypothetical protein [Frateuria sp.]NUO73854.1 hypothetical protein [Frateuria sp.]NUR21466.1 hypothetical protein [Frateuria sp.]